jgi:hypothetical protein
LSGFTLGEVVVAVGVGAIVFVTIYVGIAQCFGAVQTARHQLRATQILMERLEVIRLYNWDQINSSGYVPLKFTEYYEPEYYQTVTNGAPVHAGIVYSGTITITDAPVPEAYADTMRRAVVRLDWTNGGRALNQSMETLISEYGVQNYTY